MDKRTQILTALAAFIRQRPGLEYGNYCSGWHDAEGRKSYFREMRSIIRDKHIAERLLLDVTWRDGITETMLRDAFRAYSGRLSIEDRPDGSIALDYCTGQYFPTEYRKAAAAVLASALWAYARENMPPGSTQGATEGAMLYRNPKGKGFVSAGTYLRSNFRREYGPSIARRFFD
jgi:hypothetical protein